MALASEAWYNVFFFRFMVQEKGRTTTGIMKLSLYILTTRTKAKSNMCVWREGGRASKCVIYGLGVKIEVLRHSSSPVAYSGCVYFLKSPLTRSLPGSTVYLMPHVTHSIIAVYVDFFFFLSFLFRFRRRGS